MKIVIVDDNADAAGMLSMLLEIEGHSVLLAFSGRAGIDLISATQPDIAIVDLSMPDIGGLDVVSAAKQAPNMSNCVFLVLTGRADLDARQIATEIGVAHFFTKGADVSHLLSFLKQLGATANIAENLSQVGSSAKRNPFLAG